jgi:hypothetical protein
MLATLARQVDRLRRSLDGAGCGPDCPPQAVAVDLPDWFGTGPSEGATSGPLACPRCGRPAEVRRVTVEFCDDWNGGPAAGGEP